MKKTVLIAAVLVSLLMSGCQMRTVDEMYSPPERSQDYNNLQSAINGAMPGLAYCAPVSGENRQVVQTADLNGDGTEEFLLFARGGAERPLHILIFGTQDEEIVHLETLELLGTAFDSVEYAQMDGKSGLELIVGTQISDQVLRTVSVYSFHSGKSQQLSSANYLKFLTGDMDGDKLSELFVLRPGPTETQKGIAELYGVEKGEMVRSLEVSMSEPVGKLKRILTGQLQSGEAAVYVASAVDEDTLITDVFAVVEGVFSNVSLSIDLGTSIQTMRNYFVYADDIDADGVMELPGLMELQALENNRSVGSHNMIRWYSMNGDGTTVDKLYTYHNFLDGWYLEIEKGLAADIIVSSQPDTFDFYIDNNGTPVKLFTVHTLSGQDREAQSQQEGHFVLHRTDALIYAAHLEDGAESYGITQETVIRSFHLIHEKWKTGEM